MKQTAGEIINQIIQAFDGVTRGEGPTLHQAELTDKLGMNVGFTKEAWIEAGKLDVEFGWGHVKDEYLESSSAILSHAKPEGLRYYLPAFMCWSLRNYLISISFSVDHPIYVLCLSKSPADLGTWQKNRWEIFNYDQREAIVSYLRFMGDPESDCIARTDAVRALEFWEEFSEQAILDKKASKHKNKRH